MIYLAYKDNGPIGPCGQSCHTTKPWQRLYRFETPEDYRKFQETELYSGNKTNGRRKAEWFGPWTDDPNDGSYFEMIEVIKLENA